MRCVLLVFGLAALTVLPSSVTAGEFNPTLDIGDPAPEWKDLIGIDGKKHSLADLKSKDVVVVVFTCNSCLYSIDYEDRLVAFHKQFCGPDQRVELVAVCVNRVPEDRLPKLRERAKKKGFRFPYLYDETQKIGKAFGATRTPEFFVLNKKRRVVYMGAMDDSTKPAKVDVKYVEAAVLATLAGKKIAKSETVALGCTVRYVRIRRRKPKSP